MFFYKLFKTLGFLKISFFLYCNEKMITVVLMPHPKSLRVTTEDNVKLKTRNQKSEVSLI